MSGMKIIFIVMLISMVVAFAWDSLPIIKETVNTLLDPTIGVMLGWNLHIGFLIVVSIFALLTTLLQKYLTDQETLKEIKKEQKLIQEEMKKYKDHPEKLLDFQKKSMDLVMKSLPITMRPVVYTAIPFILLFRWYGDYFSSINEKIYGLFSTQGSFLFPGWVWAYLITSIFITSFLRKKLNVH